MWQSGRKRASLSTVDHLERRERGEKERLQNAVYGGNDQGDMGNPNALNSFDFKPVLDGPLFCSFRLASDEVRGMSEGSERYCQANGEQ